MDKQKVIVEGIKEALRIVVVAILPILYASINTQTGAINIDWRVIFAVAVVALLKALDKSIYTIGKELKAQGNWENIFKTGLTRF